VTIVLDASTALAAVLPDEVSDLGEAPCRRRAKKKARKRS